MRRVFLAVACVAVSACVFVPQEVLVEAPETIAAEALAAALGYLGAPYVYGGQSAAGVDCSGLVVLAYQAAVRSQPYTLPFEDASVRDLLRWYTVAHHELRPGDLLFMGDGQVSHVALFIERDGQDVVFVDAFETSGFVGIRRYQAIDYRFISSGRMLLRGGGALRVAL